MSPTVYLILGIALAAAAAILAVVAFDAESIIALGAAVLVGAGGAYAAYHGSHGLNSRLHAKHAAILRDLRAQGFTLRSDDVYAVDGNYYDRTSEVDLPSGACRIPLIARDVEGTWRATMPTATGVRIVTAADLARMAKGCAG